MCVVLLQIQRHQRLANILWEDGLGCYYVSPIPVVGRGVKQKYSKGLDPLGPEGFHRLLYQLLCRLSKSLGLLLHALALRYAWKL